MEIHFILFYYVYYVGFRIALFGSKWMWYKTDKEHQKKVELMQQVSLCEFQQEFKFGM